MTVDDTAGHDVVLLNLSFDIFDNECVLRKSTIIIKRPTKKQNLLGQF